MWKSREEIKKTYLDHLDSLAMWGKADEGARASVHQMMQDQLREWDKEHPEE
jgi:hypothetical protein